MVQASHTRHLWLPGWWAQGCWPLPCPPKGPVPGGGGGLQVPSHQSGWRGTNPLNPSGPRHCGQRGGWSIWGPSKIAKFAPKHPWWPPKALWPGLPSHGLPQGAPPWFAGRAWRAVVQGARPLLSGGNGAAEAGQKVGEQRVCRCGRRMHSRNRAHRRRDTHICGCWMYSSSHTDDLLRHVERPRAMNESRGRQSKLGSDADWHSQWRITI